MRLNRTGKIARNLLLCLLLGGCVYAMLGFPPYTLEGMCRRVQKEYLLPAEVEPLYVLEEAHKYSDDWFNRQYTFVLARSGENWLAFQYDRNGLQNSSTYARQTVIQRDAFCTARDGTMYVIGPLGEAASARAAVTAEKHIAVYDEATETYQEVDSDETRTFTFQGEKLAPEVFAFRYRSGSFTFFPENIPEADWDLEIIAQMWYRNSVPGENSYGLRHADLPCQVTLYDAAGQVLDTLDLTVETYDLHSDF